MHFTIDYHDVVALYFMYVVANIFYAMQLDHD